MLDALLRDRTAAKRRSDVLATTPELSPDERAVLAALDTLIDGLVSRSRPRTGAKARPNTDTEIAAPPPVPPPPRPPTIPGMPSVQGDDASMPPLAIDDDVFSSQAPPRPPHRDTTTRPVDRVPEGDSPNFEPVPAKHPATQLLYDDILNLSHINDWDAAFISIERMLVMTTVEGHIKEFVKNNEAHLLGLYEPALKSFARVPKRRELRVENTMHRAFLGNRKIQDVLALVDKKLSIKKMFDAAKLSKLEVCAVLIVLQRSGVIEI